ncbi:glutathione-regulated potassium-efflux system protein KefB [Glycocaulis alkaliphilus]|uniref:Glutathione-regulated potassium-efflux system protein KefB n=1 Tax=Glycocaulis alkaliphilus TaxID=1434191 RepID=A0A3T0E8K9_9PROT|nr:cation:proton antiporter [Glycocaulis alkaliphilus]AZU03557.1 glutathione-regulated potassium-efflux system protein KefB [Glycocaulis alkaliphilus]GGB74431.1 potassium transporter TrkA [Glycocaulis alkaliphilus]
MSEAEAILPAVWLLGVGIAAIMLARLLKTSPIVTFIAAGLLIGPFGLGLIEENGTTRLLAQLGVVFLLFDIGLGFSLKTVRESKGDLISLAPLQMILCTAGFGLVGWLAGMDWLLALLIGAAAGISATAVVTQTLAERGIATCPLGRSATAVLVFQDIAGIFLLVIAVALSEGAGGDLGTILGMSALKALLAVGVALLAGRFVIGPLFRLLSKTRNDEIFTAAALFLVLATAAATGALELSLTLGAFLAGMIIADTPFKTVIRTEARPFGALLLGFFFITVGMALDWRMMVAQAHWIVAALAVLFVLKTALTWAAAIINRWSLAGGAQLSFSLAQGSEFGLVILALPGIAAALGAELTGILVAASALSLALTPAWASLGLKIARRIADATASRKPVSAPEELNCPVLIFAMTPSGRMAYNALTRFDIPVIAIESDPDRFLSAIADGYAVTFGDPSDTRLLRAIDVTEARALVLSAPRYEISAEITPYIRENFPELQRFVAVKDEPDRRRHEALGMHAIINRSQPEGLDFALALLRYADIPESDIHEWMQEVVEAYDPDPAFRVAEPA